MFNAPLIRFALVIAATAIVYVFTKFVGSRIARRTQNDLDDAAIQIALVPVLLAGVAAAIWQLLLAPRWWGVPSGGVGWAPRLLILVAVMYTLWRLLRDVVQALASKHAQRTVSEADDVVTPILLRQVLPVVLGLVGILGLFWAFGGSIAGGIATAGGLSFLLVYLLQDPLTNLFGGLSLGLDVPFRYGDLVVLEDNKTYAVRRIGARVTKLYDIAEHNEVYLPNSTLTAQRIVNLMLPNAEVRQQVTVGIAYETPDLGVAIQLMEQIAQEHPRVLGSRDFKREVMNSRLQTLESSLPYNQYGMEALRLEWDSEMRQGAEDFIHIVGEVAASLETFELKGFDESERASAIELMADLQMTFNELRHNVALVLFANAFFQTAYRRDSYWSQIHEREDFLELFRIRAQSFATSAGFSGFIGGAGVDLDIPRATEQFKLAMQDLDFLERFTDEHQTEFASLYKAWHKPLFDIEATLEKMINSFTSPKKNTFRIHEKAQMIINITRDRIPLEIGTRRNPEATVTCIGASSIDLTLDYFVDDVIGDYFERADDVRRDLLRSIVEQFGQAQISIPFPQLEVGFT